MPPPSIACTFSDTEPDAAPSVAYKAHLAIDTLRVGLWGSHSKGRLKGRLLRLAGRLEPGTCIQERIGDVLCRVRRMERGAYRLCVTPREGPMAGLSVLVMPDYTLARSTRMPVARVVFNAHWCRVLGLIGYEARAIHAAQQLGIEVTGTFLTGVDLAVDLPLDKLDGFATSAEHVAGRARNFAMTERCGAVVSLANGASRSRASRSASIYQGPGRPVRVEIRLHRAYLKGHGLEGLEDLTPASLHALWLHLTDEYVRVVAKKNRAKKREKLHPLWPTVQAAHLDPGVVEAYDAQAHLIADPSIEACIEADGRLVYVDRTTGEILPHDDRWEHPGVTSDDGFANDRLFDADDEASGEDLTAEVRSVDGSTPPKAAAAQPRPRPPATRPSHPGRRLREPIPRDLHLSRGSMPRMPARRPLTPAEGAARRQRAREMLEYIERRCSGCVDEYMAHRGFRRRGFYYMKKGAKSVRVGDAETYWRKRVWDFENPPPPPPPPFRPPWEIDLRLVLRTPNGGGSAHHRPEDCILAS